MWSPITSLDKFASWPLTSEVREVKVEVKDTVVDSKLLYTLTFDLRCHWSSKQEVNSTKVISLRLHWSSWNFLFKNIPVTPGHSKLWPRRLYQTPMLHTYGQIVGLASISICCEIIRNVGNQTLQCLHVFNFYDWF